MTKTTEKVPAGDLCYLTLTFATGRRQRFKVTSDEGRRVASLFENGFTSGAKPPDALVRFQAMGGEQVFFRLDAIHGVAVRAFLVKSDSSGASLLYISKVTGLAYQTLRRLAEKDKKGAKRLTWVSERKLELTKENLIFLGVPHDEIEKIITK